MSDRKSFSCSRFRHLYFYFRSRNVFAVEVTKLQVKSDQRGYRSMLTWIVSGFLVMCVLNMAVLAVPETPRFIVVSVGEVGKDIRFGYLSRNFPSKVVAAIFGCRNGFPDLQR